MVRQRKAGVRGNRNKYRKDDWMSVFNINVKGEKLASESGGRLELQSM